MCYLTPRSPPCRRARGVWAFFSDIGHGKQHQMKTKSFIIFLFWALCGGESVSAGALDNPRIVFDHFPNVNVDAHVAQIAKWHFADIRDGAIPTNPAALKAARRVPTFDWAQADAAQIAAWFRKALHAWALGGTAEKRWRVSNNGDIYRGAGCLSDAFWSSTHLGERAFEMNPLMAGLFRLIDGFEYREETRTLAARQEQERLLREICAADVCARDLIVGIGLVNCDLPGVKKLAIELAPRSEVNWPVYALRIPQEEARRLLGGRKEHARLLSNLEIRAMTPGPARVEAIRRHWTTFPDYTEAEMPRTSVALNTFAELAAVAGADLVNAGRPKEALSLWLERGGCPEDVALVAEQILSLDELREMVERHPWRPTRRPLALPGLERPKAEGIWAVHCSRTLHHKGRFLGMNAPETLCAYIRTIYAKRLMRAGRFREAVPYFHRSEDYARAVRYVQLATRFEAADAEHPTPSDVRCGLTLGAFLRQCGGELFGTELEPDNMINRGTYPCVWATNNLAVAAMRHIVETNRFHYRRRTAEVYRRTADLAERTAGLPDAARLWGFCHMLSGRLMRYAEPRMAYDHLEAVRRRLPELCRDFYRDPVVVGAPYDGWLVKDNWLGDDDPLAAFPDTVPSVPKVPLPPHRETADDLMRVGIELFSKAADVYCSEIAFLSHYAGPLYAFFRAGQLGRAEGYARCADLCLEEGGDVSMAVLFLKAARRLNRRSPVVQYQMARLKLALGLQYEGYGDFKRLAEGPCSDAMVLLMARDRMLTFSRRGFHEIAPNPELAQRYRRLLDGQ